MAYLFPLLTGISLLAGLWLCERRSGSPELARKAYVVGAVAGIIGARLWYVAQYGGLTVSTGMSCWGFGIGATLGSIAYLRWQTGHWAFGEFASIFGDPVAPAIAAGAAMTRLACFFVGCNFGTVTSLPWAVQYGPDSLAFRKQVVEGLLDPASPLSRPVHPTQLYETVAWLFAFLAILGLGRAARFRLLKGELLLGLGLYYCVFRFLTEYLRDDSGGRHLGPLTFAQATSVGVGLLSLALLIRGRWPQKQFTFLKEESLC